MKTLGFQTFLYNPEVEPRGIQLIKQKTQKSSTPNNQSITSI